MQHLRNAIFIFPVMGYFLIESVIIALFVSFVWNFFLDELFQIQIRYVQWVGIIWIIKTLFFNVFNLLPTLKDSDKNNNDEN